MYYDSATLLKFWVTNYSSGGVSQIAVDPLAENTVVGTYDGTSIRLCANGVAGSKMTTGGINANTGPLEFGRGRSDSFNINGLIRRVTILDYALPLEEALHVSGSP